MNHKSLALIILIITLGCPTISSSSASSFESCEDAFNYGSNTSHLFVSNFFNRLACDPILVNELEATLADAFKRKFAIGDNNYHNFCLVQGVYQGYLEQLVTEYNDCDNERFSFIPQESLALVAEAIFIALLKTLPESAALREYTAELFHRDYSFVGTRLDSEFNCVDFVTKTAIIDLELSSASSSDLQWSLLDIFIDEFCYSF